MTALYDRFAAKLPGSIFRDRGPTTTVGKVARLFTEELDTILGVADVVPTLRDINTATGANLDELGRLLSEPRLAKSDADYRLAQFIAIARLNSDWSIPKIIEVCMLLTDETFIGQELWQLGLTPLTWDGTVLLDGTQFLIPGGDGRPAAFRISFQNRPLSFLSPSNVKAFILAARAPGVKAFVDVEYIEPASMTIVPGALLINLDNAQTYNLDPDGTGNLHREVTGVLELLDGASLLDGTGFMDPEPLTTEDIAMAYVATTAYSLELAKARNNERTIPQINYVAVGTGTGAPTGAETQLGAEVYREAVATPVRVGNAVTYTLNLGGSEANPNAITEVGFFSEASGTANSGLLNYIARFTAKNKDSDTTMSFTLEETIS